MSTSATPLLTIISQQMVICLGLCLFITGLFGEILNIIAFLSLETFRQSSCAFYLLIMSMVNICHLFIGVFTFIMINGFGISWTNMSLFYCKFRAFYVQLGLLVSLTCICSATIDQFLATCSNPRWHRWSNIKTARYMVIGAAIVWILHGIPFIIYNNHIISSINGTAICVITNVVFQKYFTSVYGCTLTTSVPVSIMILFGILGYRNVREIGYRTVPLVRRELDKQLTTMVLTQAFCDVLFVIPLFLYNASSGIIGTISDPATQIRFGFIGNITTIWYIGRFVSPFYIYISVSKRFRQQLIHVLFTVHLNQCRRPRMPNNQVEPQT